MFVEKLTVNKVKSFLNEIYSEKEGYCYSIIMPEKTTPKKNYIYANISRDKDDFNMNMRLEDYDALMSRPFRWLQFLYKTFGEEYKQEYIKECLLVFDED